MTEPTPAGEPPSAWPLLLQWGVLTNLMLIALIVLAECTDRVGSSNATAIAAAILAIWATACAGLGLAALLPARRWRAGDSGSGI